MDISENSRLELLNLLQSLGEKIGPATGDDLERAAGRHLQAMHDSLRRITKGGKDDVFACYLLERIEALADVCEDAAAKGVLRVTEHEFGTPQLLINAFGIGKKVFRYTWQMAAGQRLFEDETWRRHFELTSSLAMSGAIEIRALAIVPDHSAAEAANIRKLLAFFATQENMAVKIVAAANWDASVVDHGMSANCIEFGIYGDNLLYRADSYTPVSVGSWSKNTIDIERYTRFFDAMWVSSAVARENPASADQKVRMSEVMAADGAVERRQGAVSNAVQDSLARIEERLNSDAA